MRLKFRLYFHFEIFTLFVSDFRFDVILNGETKFKGAWAKDAASIAYSLAEKNVFILGQLSDRNVLKMIKIQVTGKTTFEWLDAKTTKKLA